nr:MAG TPA: hypothetical protein [Caudoviricetes sp.]
MPRATIAAFSLRTSIVFPPNLSHLCDFSSKSIAHSANVVNSKIAHSRNFLLSCNFHCIFATFVLYLPNRR